MDFIWNLIKEEFNLFVKMHWLKTIDRERRKCVKLKEKTDQQAYILNALIKRYNEIYNTDPIQVNERSVNNGKTPCDGCYYWRCTATVHDSSCSCDYILIEHRCRPCPPGKDCTVKDMRAQAKRRYPFTVFTRGGGNRE